MSGGAGGGSLPEGAAKVRAVDEMFDAIAPGYERLNGLFSLGLDARWRRRAVLGLGPVGGERVLDLACGTGDLCREAAAAGAAPVGVDRSAGMLTAGRVRSAPLVQGDALALPFARGSFDAGVCGFALRNFVSLAPVLAECARVLRRGGRLALLDVSVPAWGPARAVHGLYFGRVVPLLGGLLSDGDAYRYLPRSVAYLPPPDQLVEEVAAAGFGDVRHRTLTMGAAQLLTGTRA